jgi:hypothetical protein
MNWQEKLESAKSNFPKLQVLKKKESLLMISLNSAFVLLGNINFQSKYATTIGSTIYLPDDWENWDEATKFEIISHELIHVRQFKKYGIFLFSLMYLLLPIPFGFAYFRAIFEMEAYAESLRIVKGQRGIEFLEREDYKNFTINLFTGPAYGWMMIHRPFVERWYDSEVQKLKNA